MIVTLAIGMRRNDAAIEGNYGTATATVLTVSPLRTGIEFVDETGATVRPENGVLYPGLLAVGQQFVVEYSTENPQIARVAGRTAGVGNLMLVAALAWHRRDRRAADLVVPAPRPACRCSDSDGVRDTRPHRPGRPSPNRGAR